MRRLSNILPVVDAFIRVVGLLIMTVGVCTAGFAAFPLSSIIERVVCGTTGTVLICIGWFLCSTQKKTVLYLRRFGVPERGNIMRNIFKKYFFRTHRLITLDGLDFEPHGVNASTYITAYAISGVSGFIAASPLFFAIAVLCFGSIGGIALVTIPLIVNIALPVFIPVIHMSFILFVILIVSFVSVKTTAKDSQQSVLSIDEWPNIRKMLYSLKKWYRRPLIMGPIATVLRVREIDWFEVVKDISKDVDVIIIDVTEITENVAKEILFVNDCAKNKAIYIRFMVGGSSLNEESCQDVVNATEVVSSLDVIDIPSSEEKITFKSCVSVINLKLTASARNSSD